MKCATFFFLVLFAMLAAVNGIADKNELVLSNTSIGPLSLDKEMKLDVDELKRLFSGYTLESGIGQQDGPDYTYYEISNDEEVLLHIKAQDEDPSRVEIIYIRSELVTDEYGLKVGMSYKDIKRIRPKLIHNTDYHYHTYMAYPEESILYEITGDFEGPDRTDFKESEIDTWTISEIIWIPR